MVNWLLVNSSPSWHVPEEPGPLCGSETKATQALAASWRSTADAGF